MQIQDVMVSMLRSQGRERIIQPEVADWSVVLFRYCQYTHWQFYNMHWYPGNAVYALIWPPLFLQALILQGVRKALSGFWSILSWQQSLCSFLVAQTQWTSHFTSLGKCFIRLWYEGRANHRSKVISWKHLETMMHYLARKPTLKKSAPSIWRVAPGPQQC